MNYDTLSNEDLLKIIIGENCNNPVEEMIEKFGDLSDIIQRTTEEELLEIRGLGPKRTSQIMVLREIGYRLYQRTVMEKYKISSPADAFNLLKSTYMFEDVEKFRIILLDTKNNVKSVELISTGTVNSSLVHPREVMNPAVKRRASSLILTHQHPSHETEPSHEDIILTNRLVEAGKLLGIPIIDHIIFGGHQFMSFKEEGLI